MSGLYEGGVLGESGPVDTEILDPAEDLAISFPRNDALTVPTGETEHIRSVNMGIRKFTVDLPVDVELTVFRDGQQFFHSPGDEAGTWEFKDNPPTVKSRLRLVFNNTSGSPAQTRATFIGPPGQRGAL